MLIHTLYFKPTAISPKRIHTQISYVPEKKHRHNLSKCNRSEKTDLRTRIYMVSVKIVPPYR